MNRLRLVLALLVAFSLVAADRVVGQVGRSHPRLLVILMIDQMRADYVDHYAQQWTGGLRRLVERGAYFRQAAYPYLNTVTCAGHATVSTGTFPATHGMVLNQWWDRASGKAVTCTEDAGTPLLSYGTPAKGGDSPARLRATSLAQELRAHFGPSSRAAVFSLKGDSAIMLAGGRVDVVAWLHEPSHQWVTSSAFAASPVPFVKDFVRRHPLAAEISKTWTRLLPADRYLFDDDASGERPPKGWTRTFPHPLAADGSLPASSYALWEASPFSDEYLADLASSAVDRLKLGRGAATDFVAIGFSALDLVGHRFGPRSHEVQDVLARLDQTIARLLDHLDRRVGPENYVVALSADHGVAFIPEQLAAEGIDAGRIVSDEIGTRVEKAVAGHLGEGRYVARVMLTDLYFRPGVAARVAANAPTSRAVIEAIESVPGVDRVFMASELIAKGTAARDNIAEAAALSYFLGRSGDVIVVPRANWFFAPRDTPSASAAATTHGTANGYDARVPLVLMGPGIKPGEYLQSATPADIAPTMAFLAGITMRRVDGRVLAEAIDGAGATSSQARPANNFLRRAARWSPLNPEP